MSKKRKCVPVDKIWFWSIAGYAAYSLALYIWRKPACGHVERICHRVNEDQS